MPLGWTLGGTEEDIEVGTGPDTEENRLEMLSHRFH